MTAAATMSAGKSDDHRGVGGGLGEVEAVVLQYASSVRWKTEEMRRNLLRVRLRGAMNNASGGADRLVRPSTD